MNNSTSPATPPTSENSNETTQLLDTRERPYWGHHAESMPERPKGYRGNHRRPWWRWGR